MKPITEILTEIPLLTQEAYATWGTQPVSADGLRTRGVPRSTVLADLDRMLVLSGGNDHDGLGVLSTWVQSIIHEMDEAGEPEPEWPADTASACAWLSAHLRWCAGRGLEAGLHDDLRRLWSSLRAICRVHDPHKLPCLTQGCAGSMTTMAGMLECEHGHRHDGLRKWRHHPSMTLDDVAAALNVPARTLRHWVGRGTIRTDEAKGVKPRHVWPWDVLRERYPELVAMIEQEEAATADAG